MTNTPHIVVAGTRRSWSPEQKRAILAEAEDPATTASAVARRYDGLHSSLLFRWRRALRTKASPLPVASRPSFVPLALPAPQPPVRDEPPHPGAIEIELAGGHRLRAEAGADVVLLQGVIAALLSR